MIWIIVGISFSFVFFVNFSPQHFKPINTISFRKEMIISNDFCWCLYINYCRWWLTEDSRVWNTECSQIQRGQDYRWSTSQVHRWRRRLHHWHALSPSKRIIFIKSLLGLNTSHLVTRLSLVTIGLVSLRNNFHLLYLMFEILLYPSFFFLKKVWVFVVDILETQSFLLVYKFVPRRAKYKINEFTNYCSHHLLVFLFFCFGSFIKYIITSYQEHNFSIGYKADHNFNGLLRRWFDVFG